MMVDDEFGIAELRTQGPMKYPEAFGPDQGLPTQAMGGRINHRNLVDRGFVPLDPNPLCPEFQCINHLAAPLIAQ